MVRLREFLLRARISKEKMSGDVTNFHYIYRAALDLPTTAQ
jgi:hypothetical protein